MTLKISVMDFDELQKLSALAIETEDELVKQKQTISDLKAQLTGTDTDADEAIQGKIDDIEKRIEVLINTKKDVAGKIAALITPPPAAVHQSEDRVLSPDPIRSTFPSSDVQVLSSPSNLTIPGVPAQPSYTNKSPYPPYVPNPHLHTSTAYQQQHYQPASPTLRYDYDYAPISNQSSGHVMSSVKSNFKVPMPSKYSSNENFERFCKRFEEYVIMANIRDNNLYLHLLSLVDNDTYDKLTRVQLTDVEKTRLDLFIPKYLEVLYPKSETRTLRVEFSRLSQRLGETVDEFATRIREMASRAYDNSNRELKEESSLQTFIQGLTDSEIKVKLYEAEVNTLDEALILARKQIKIRDTVRKSADDFQVLRVSSGNAQQYETGQRTAVSSYSGKEKFAPSPSQLQNHKDFLGNNSRMLPVPAPVHTQFPASTMTGSGNQFQRPSRPRSRRYGNNVDHIQCYRCLQFGHVMRQCPYSEDLAAYLLGQMQEYQRFNQGQFLNNQGADYQTSSDARISHPLNSSRAVSQPGTQPETTRLQQSFMLQPTGQHRNPQVNGQTNHHNGYRLQNQKEADKKRVNSW